MQVDNEADADIVVIPYWVDLLCRMSQESELLWDEFNKANTRNQVPFPSGMMFTLAQEACLSQWPELH